MIKKLGKIINKLNKRFHSFFASNDKEINLKFAQEEKKSDLKERIKVEEQNSGRKTNKYNLRSSVDRSRSHTPIQRGRSASK